MNDVIRPKRNLFYIHSFLLPFLAIFFAQLSFLLGMTCGDTCRVHSMPFVYFANGILYFIALSNIILFMLCKKKIEHKKIGALLVLLNCIFCFYALLFLNGGAWAFLVIIWPAFITIPMMIMCWGKLMLSENVPAWSRVLAIILLIFAMICDEQFFDYIAKLLFD